MGEGVRIEGDWFDGVIPGNVVLGESVFIETSYCFHCFRNQAEGAMHIGRASSIYGQTRLDVGPRGRLDIGEFTMLNSMCITADARVRIGSYCLLSWNVLILDHCRIPRAVDARRRLLEGFLPWRGGDLLGDETGEMSGEVTIGDNVWIGFDSIVMPGVRIGEGSVIGSRSVVVEDVAPMSVAVGNPARVIRTLEESDHVSAAG